MTRPIRHLAVTSLVWTSAACGAPAPPATSPAGGGLDAQIRRFAPVDLTVSLDDLPPAELDALRHLLRAARLMDGLFLDQVWSGNSSLLAALAGAPDASAELRYFLINKGPWSRLDGNAPFLPPAYGVPPKPGQASYYPADASRDEIDTWIRGLTGDARAQATSFFTVIRRGPYGLVAVPYSLAYQNLLIEAASHLRAAAAATSQPTLKRYLDLRAAAFVSNDYYPSDVAWMELDASIEPTIGPYETYEDEWFGYKAAFEAFVTLRDDAETAKLAAFGRELQALEDALPIDPRYRNPRIGALAPLRVVNVILTAGDANRGVQTAAFNLPNDDRVIREKGSKRVMLKNVQEAKFQKVLLPVSAVAIAPADRKNVSFDAFFTHILMHELMHGLGPHQVYAGTPGAGGPTGATGTGSAGLAVRLALKDAYATIEEAKADISGLWALQQLADRGIVSADIARSMYTTFLASAFRTIRFGLSSSHARGQVMQLNFLLDRGAVTVAADGTFAIVEDRIREAVASLTRELMTLQAEGDYAAARDLLAARVVIRPEVRRVLDRLAEVPVDIAPRFVTADYLLGR